MRPLKKLGCSQPRDPHIHGARGVRAEPKASPSPPREPSPPLYRNEVTQHHQPDSLSSRVGCGIFVLRDQHSWDCGKFGTKTPVLPKSTATTAPPTEHETHQLRHEGSATANVDSAASLQAGGSQGRERKVRTRSWAGQVPDLERMRSNPLRWTPQPVHTAANPHAGEI